MVLQFFNKKNISDDYFLGIFLKEQKGTLILMKKEKEEIFIKDKINFSYTNGWENLTEDIDENLYQLEEKYKITVSKTIFFLYSHFIDDVTKNIKAPYLKKIKSLVKDLSLEALGYIECFEAISLYLEKKDQNLLTATIIEIDKTQISVFVYQGGKLVYKNNLAQTDNIIDDFIIAISELKDKNILLPSRIVIYDSENINEKAEKLINYQWDKNYFIQIPKIEILNEQEIINSLVKIFSKQIKKTSDNIEFSEKKFGFLIGEDINETKKEKKLNIVLPVFYFPKLNFNLFFNSKIIVFVGFLLFILGLLVNEYFFHKVFLTIYLPSKKIEKKLESAFDYKISTLSAKFSETISTTGKKEIGSKAKGTVVIHNFDDKEITLTKSTIIESAGLKFLLENDVKIASSTLTADASAKLPGKKEVNVIAEHIGSEANLQKGNRFKIQGYSENLCFAINDKELTGGSKKQIRTVSESDLISLENKIIEKAKKYNFDFKLNNDEKIIKNLTEYKFIDKKFSKELGEEADSLTLDAKVIVNYYLYSKNKVIDFLVDEFKKDLDKDLILLKDNINFEIIEANKKNNQIKIILQAKAKATGIFDEKKAKKLILGKNKNKIEDILKSNFNINGYNLVIKQSLPLIDNFLPFFEKNIYLKISYL